MQARARLEVGHHRPGRSQSEAGAMRNCPGQPAGLDEQPHATVVDTWRLITFNANALKSGLTVSFNGALGTRATTRSTSTAPHGHMSAGLRVRSPLHPAAERNNYRQA